MINENSNKIHFESVIRVDKIFKPKSVYAEKLDLHEGDYLKIEIDLKDLTGASNGNYALEMKVTNIMTSNVCGFTQNQFFNSISKVFSFTQINNW